jgi:hypothetical protein
LIYFPKYFTVSFMWRGIFLLREKIEMETLNWVKPAILGGVIGAICLGVVGFTGAGWLTASKAAANSSDRPTAEIVAALLPICVHQAESNPKFADRLSSLKGKQQEFQRSASVEEWGWATMPGSERANSHLARACAEALNG